jgi:sigma-B regulation protein RsbU (phosphoserine phosphatase)
MVALSSAVQGQRGVSFGSSPVARDSAHVTEAKPNRLETLYRVSQALGSTLDLDPLLEAVLDQVIDVTGAERGFLMLGDTADRMEYRVARGMDRQAISSPEFEISRGVVERVARDAEPVLSADVKTDEWLSSRDSVMNLQLRSLMCVPLQVKGVPLGLVYVDNRIQAGIFSGEDLELLQAVANQAAVAIENARLHQVALEGARLERELELAREIQASLIPGESPQFPGYDISGLWRSAREVAGDFYDFIPRADGGLGVIIGDVTDKGVPAAFFMALARTSIRASILEDEPLALSMAKANRLICQDSQSGMFVTLYLVHLAKDTGEGCSVSAGHNPPLWYQARTQGVSPFPKGSLPLGIMEEAKYQEQDLALETGDVLLLHTDGVIDAENLDGVNFGEDRLKAALAYGAGAAARGIVGGIWSSIDEFTEGTAPIDDITMVAIKRV